MGHLSRRGAAEQVQATRYVLDGAAQVFYHAEGRRGEVHRGHEGGLPDLAARGQEDHRQRAAATTAEG